MGIAIARSAYGREISICMCFVHAHSCDQISPSSASYALNLTHMLCDRVLCFLESKESAPCFGRSQPARNTLAVASSTHVPVTSRHFQCEEYLTSTTHTVSLNAAGVDIAPFSAMPGEAEVLLLPGLPLVNFPGENPETDLWTFEVETPGESVVGAGGGSPPVMIDYVHPGAVFG